MYQSKNTIVRSCLNYAALDANSCIGGAKLALLRTLFSSISYVMLLSTFHKIELL